MSKLPFPALVLDQHSVTLGKTGSGKSSAMRVVAEYSLDQKRRVVIVDPKGDWWGLKSAANGKSAGYPVICFGSFKEPRATDVPLNEGSGRHVAELITAGNRPCVIGFRGWMPAQMMRFWIGTKDNPGFAQTLFNTNSGELKVFIDEVHNFAPKGKVQDPDSGKSLHWTNRIMSEGRGLGMTFYIASQRPQKVHNDTLENCETLIAMRVTHPRSREATEEWINAKGDPKFAKEVMSTLADLNRGEAWVWSPENGFGPKRVQFPMFSTFDSFAPPQLQKKVTGSGWSEVDLDQVKQKLASVIAEHKANDPKELRAEIARLRADLAKKQVAVPAATHKPAAAVVDQKAIERAVQAAVHANREPLLKQLKQIHGAIAPVLKAVRSLAEIHDSFPLAGPNPIFPKVAVAPTRSTPEPVRTPTPIVRTAPVPTNGRDLSGDLSKGQQNIIDQLAQLEALRIKNPVKAQISLMCGYANPRSGGFAQPVADLAERGLISNLPGKRLALTEGGRALANHVTEPVTVSELHDRFYSTLGEGEGKILREVIAAYPDALAKEVLAPKIGYQNPRSGGFAEPMANLYALGAVTYPAPREVKAADWLFLEAA